MKARSVITAVSNFLMAAVVFGGSEVIDTQGKVYPDPAKPYPRFKSHELSFKTSNDGVARAEYRSEPFYAIILKTVGRCSVSEEERLKVQTLFLKNKVFSNRFECDDNPEENVTYTNVNTRFDFIAVYAGSTLSQAKQLLAEVEATGQFPRANIRKMQVVRVYP
jgi:hypothetical protein